jgi:hypothetical protein
MAGIAQRPVEDGFIKAYMLKSFKNREEVFRNFNRTA